jgi:hypothetical protein
LNAPSESIQEQPITLEFSFRQVFLFKLATATCLNYYYISSRLHSQLMIGACLTAATKLNQPLVELGRQHPHL